MGLAGGGLWTSGAGVPGLRAAGVGGFIEVFTTRPDTLSGATYLVLAPEHPLVSDLIADVPDGVRAAVRAYREATSRLSDRQRTAGIGAKTGVFTGRSVTNPVTGEPIPVFSRTTC